MGEVGARSWVLILGTAAIALGGGAFGQQPRARPAGVQRMTLEQVKQQVGAASNPLARLGQLSVETAREHRLGEEVYFKLLIAQRRRTYTDLNLKALERQPPTGGSSTMSVRATTAEPNSPEIAEAKRALLTRTNDVRKLTASLNSLMGWPDDIALELVPPDPLTENISLQEITRKLGAASSPAVVEAEQNVVKARHAFMLSKLEYVPTMAAVGGFWNQNVVPVVPTNLGYGGVIETYNLLDFGKRERAVKEAKIQLEMAQIALQMTKAQRSAKLKDSYFELERSRRLSRLAQTMGSPVVRLAKLRSNATDPETEAARVTVEIEMLEADLAHRQAYAKLKALIGPCDPNACQE